MKLEDIQLSLTTIERQMLSFLFSAIKDGFIQEKDNFWYINKLLDKDLKDKWNGVNRILKEYINDNIPKGTLLHDNINKSIDKVDAAIDFKIPYAGKKDLVWQLMLDYSDLFLNLKNCLYDTVYWSNSIDKFIFYNKDKLREFNKFDGINIFVSINYKGDKSQSDELDFIEQLLRTLEGEYKVKFHYATDQRWLDNIFDNLKFYMIACHLGLAFFTKSNNVERGIEHNASVAHELGFVQGLGKKAVIVKHKDIEPFANISGLLTDNYNRTIEIKAILEKILNEYGVCKQSF